MQIKLIIWDLDDTLWTGTLADGDAVSLKDNRAQMVRDFNLRGVVSSICSKNERATAQAKLEELELWDQFVFAHIDVTPKEEAVKHIIEDMQLHPADVLFVDGNRHALESVRALSPEIHILDALAGDTDAILEALLSAQPVNARNRLREYRMLEARTADRKSWTESEEAFLRQCDIHCCSPLNPDNLDFVEFAADLINRSNRLNYTQSRVTVESLTAEIIDLASHDSWTVFARDRYGDLGLVGFVMVHRKRKRLVHFVFSSRVTDMGLENFMLTKVYGKEPTCTLEVLEGRITYAHPSWIRNEDFNGPGVRERLIAAYRPAAVGDTDIRIMLDCMSGGLAHFSRLRSRIAFDHSPRVFSLRHMITQPDDIPPFHPTLVYGAGVDYADPRWPDLADLLDEGLFEGCVHLFCERVVNDGARLLVVLPSEDSPEDRYRPHMRQTRMRTIMYNGIWRAALHYFPSIEIFELTGYARGEDMADVSHFYAPFLQKMAALLDDWFEGKALPEAAAA